MNRPQAYRLTVSSPPALLVMAALPATVVSQESAIAIVGATIIDVNGGGVVHVGDHTHKVASAVEGKQLGDMPRRYGPPSLKHHQDPADWIGKLRGTSGNLSRRTTSC